MVLVIWDIVILCVKEEKEEVMLKYCKIILRNFRKKVKKKISVKKNHNNKLNQFE